VLLFVYGGPLSRAYYGVSSAIASVVAYSSSLAFALYPKLLAGAKSDDVTLSLRMVLMFAMPMLIGAIILSEDLLLTLNPAYGAASPILIILALSSLFASLSSIFESIIMGVENFDAVAKVSFRRAFKSNLFLLLTLQYVQAAIILPPIYLALSLSSESLLSALYFALISCIGDFITMMIRLFIARRSMPLIMPWAG